MLIAGCRAGQCTGRPLCRISEFSYRPPPSGLCVLIFHSALQKSYFWFFLRTPNVGSTQSMNHIFIVAYVTTDTARTKATADSRAFRQQTGQGVNTHTQTCASVNKQYNTRVVP